MRTQDRTLLQSLGFADPDKKDPDHDLACRYLSDIETATRLVRTLGAFWDKRRPTPVGCDSVCWFDEDSHELPPIPAECPTVERSVAEKHPGYHFREFIYHQPVAIRTALEVSITKGDGKYKSFIGFADLMIEASRKYSVSGWNSERRWRYPHEREIHRQPGDDGPWFRDCLRGPSSCFRVDLPTKDNYNNGTCLVEVKTQKQSMHSCIRQIKLYKEFLTPPYLGGPNWTPPVLATTYPLSSEDIPTLANEGL